jgi:hypothetical protein
MHERLKSPAPPNQALLDHRQIKMNEMIYSSS